MLQTIHKTLGTILLSAVVFTVNAEQIAEVSIPEKVKEDIIKRHPKAHDLQAGHETHFGQNLLEVTFKIDEVESLMELFIANGTLFTDELPLADLSEAPPVVKETLEKTYPKYEFKKAELIANPNGPGEEYEVYLVHAGANWKVGIDGKGRITGKEQYQ